MRVGQESSHTRLSDNYGNEALFIKNRNEYDDHTVDSTQILVRSSDGSSTNHGASKVTWDDGSSDERLVIDGQIIK